MTLLFHPPISSISPPLLYIPLLPILEKVLTNFYSEKSNSIVLFRVCSIYFYIGKVRVELL